MAKSGVTAPPMNPAESVRIVSANFRIQSYPATFPIKSAVPAALPVAFPAAVPTTFAASPIKSAFPAIPKHISNKFVPSPA